VISIFSQLLPLAELELEFLFWPAREAVKKSTAFSLHAKCSENLNGLGHPGCVSMLITQINKVLEN